MKQNLEIMVLVIHGPDDPNIDPIEALEACGVNLAQGGYFKNLKVAVGDIRTNEYNTVQGRLADHGFTISRAKHPIMPTPEPTVETELKADDYYAAAQGHSIP